MLITKFFLIWKNYISDLGCSIMVESRPWYNLYISLQKLLIFNHCTKWFIKIAKSKIFMYSIYLSSYRLFLKKYYLLL